jgi:hypothetical protein
VNTTQAASSSSPVPPRLWQGVALRALLALLLTVSLSSTFVLAPMASYLVAAFMVTTPLWATPIFLGLGLLAAVGLDVYAFQSWNAVSGLALSALVGITLGAFVRRRARLQHLLVAIPLVLATLSCGVLVGIHVSTPGGVVQAVDRQLATYAGRLEQNSSTPEMLKNEKRLVQEWRADFKENGEIYLLKFPATVLSIWALWVYLAMFLLMRNLRLVPTLTRYTMAAELDLYRFKAPALLIYGVIGALALSVGGEFLTPAPAVVGGFGDASAYGEMALVCCGVFYFLQGAGIAQEALLFWGVGSFFRTLLVVFVGLSYPVIFAVLGLFDYWADFRRFLKKTPQT